MKIEISSRTNPRLQELLRQRDDVYLFEGEKLVGDLIDRHIPLQKLIYTPDWTHANFEHRPKASEEWLVSPQVMKKLSLLDDPPDVAAVAGMLEGTVDWGKVSWVSAFDGIQDPANMGSVLRCASAFAVDALVFCGSTVRPTHSKVIRAAQTAMFDVCFQVVPSLEEVISEAIFNGLKIYSTSSHIYPNSIPPEEMKPPGLIVFGSEGRGVPDHIIQSHTPVFIAQESKMESLNVAVSACILFRELYKRRSV